MSKVKRFGVTQMRQQQAFEFINKVCSCIAPVTPEFTIYHDALKKANEEFDKTLAYHPKSIYTEEIRNSDRRRYLAWRALRTVVNSLLLTSDPGYKLTIREADKILRTYGNPGKLSSTEQTGVIKNLIDDFITLINEDSRKYLGLTNFIEELEEANKEFSLYIAQREYERSIHVNGEAQVMRKQVNKAYNDMVQALNVLSDLDKKNEDFQTFILSINQLIDEENVVIKLRRTLRKNQKEADAKKEQKE